MKCCHRNSLKPLLLNVCRDFKPVAVTGTVTVPVKGKVKGKVPVGIKSLIKVTVRVTA
jgi:hypothetical protein